MREFYDDPATRSRAMNAMWRSLDRQFADYFPQHLDDPDRDVLREAIWGVGYLGIGTEAGKLRAFFDQDDLRPDALFSYALSVPAEISRGRVRGMLRKIDDLAGGLTQAEQDLVMTALDERLIMHRLEPVFSAMPDGDPIAEEGQSEPSPEVGRNDPCPCGSGKKYKKCHGS